MFNFFRKCRGSRTGEPSEADFGVAHGQISGPATAVTSDSEDIENPSDTRQTSDTSNTNTNDTRYLRATETKAVKELEKRRSGILTHETELDRKLDDVDMFMLNSITLYVIMVTGSSLSGVVVSKKIALYSLIVSVVSVFAVGLVGIAILSFKKLKKLKWKVDQVTDMRSTLFDEVEGLMNLLKGVNYGLESIADGEEAITVSMAKARLNKISNSLAPLSGNYQEDHMIFLTVTCVGCGLYLVLLAMWLYFSHAGGNTVTVSKGASPLVLYAWIGYMPAFSFACAFILRGVMRMLY